MIAHTYLTRFMRVASLLFLAASCNSDEAIGGDVGGVALSETSVRVGVGAAVQLKAFVQLAGGGSELRTTGIEWTTSDGAVASVDQTGTVRGEKLGGPVMITAAVAGRSAHATVQVVPATVEITPPVSTLAVGATVQFTAIPLDANGAPLAAATPVWTAEFPGADHVATLTPDGRLTIHAPGVVTVAATISGQQGRRTIGVPSAYDGVWSGTSADAAVVEFAVQYGVVSGFRLPMIVRQACSRQLLSLQTGVVGPDGRFALSLGASTGLVTGTFATPTTMSGTYGEISTTAGCAPDTQGNVPPGTFTATRN